MVIILVIDMNKNKQAFHKEIEFHKSAETVPTDSVRLETRSSSLAVRLRGCFVTDCQLTNPITHDRIKVLHADPDQTKPGLNSSHIMMPVGPSSDIGGRHGFPRWADYHEVSRNESDDGHKQIALQAGRSDMGLGLAKMFEISDRFIITNTTAFNSEDESVRTSLGEHLYFNLINEKVDGLMVEGVTLDNLLGEGSTEAIMRGEPCFWDGFDQEAVIHFPAGYTIRLRAETDVDESVGMLIWHRPGTDSICFEPTVGYNPEYDGNSGLEIEAYSMRSLTTAIEVIA